VDGTPVPKHVGTDTKHEMYRMICIVLFCIECICWLIYRNVLPVCQMLWQRSESNGDVTCKTKKKKIYFHCHEVQRKSQL
jgi:hypothetical protein